MYSILVLQCGISPEYVLDKMQFYEIQCLMDNLWRKDKEGWEQTRVMGYITAQSQSTKKLDMKELMPFEWDKEKVQEDVPPTEDERKAIFEEMKAMEKKLNIQ